MATVDKKKRTLTMFDTVTGSNEGSEIELYDRNGDLSGVKVRMLGPDSDEAIRADRAALNRNMKFHSKQQSNKIDVNHDVIEKLVAVTVGWSGMPDENGNDLPFSKDNARRIYTEFPAIRRDMLREHEDTKNFIKDLSAK